MGNLCEGDMVRLKNLDKINKYINMIKVIFIQSLLVKIFVYGDKLITVYNDSIISENYYLLLLYWSISGRILAV